MIDFVSTRPGVDAQAARGAKLLAAIIADAVRQASKKPTRRELDAKRNFDAAEGSHPALSIWFLFDDESPFNQYAQLIGLSAPDMRAALLSDRKLNEQTIKGSPAAFTAIQRRIIKIRYRFYLLEKQAKNNATKKPE